MNRTAADYEREAEECLATAVQNNVGTHQAAYWIARAHVYATLAVAAATTAHSAGSF